MRNIGENDITNMGGAFNYINCECITDVGNLADFSTFIDGYVDFEGNIVLGSNKEMTSDYIPVTVGKTYLFTYDGSLKTGELFWTAISCYDSDKNFITRYAETVYSLQSTMPKNTAYIRVSARFLKGASWVKVTEV